MRGKLPPDRTAARRPRDAAPRRGDLPLGRVGPRRARRAAWPKPSEAMTDEPDPHRHPQLRALPRELLVGGVPRFARTSTSPASGTTIRSAAPNPPRATARGSSPSLDALLDAVDAVAVCSDTAAHRPLIERAAARGKHVLCEKPIATTRDDARAIAAAIERAGVRFMQSFPKRFDPANHEIRRRLDGGLLRHAVARARAPRPPLRPRRARSPRGWWADPARSGGGTLLDEGVHGADFLRWLFGDPESVTAMVSDRDLGARGRGHRARDLPVPRRAPRRARDRLELPGRRRLDRDLRHAGHRAPLRRRPRVQGAHRERLPALLFRGPAGAHLGGRRRSCRDSRPAGSTSRTRSRSSTRSGSGAPPPMGLEDGRRSLAMILAAYAAAQTGTTQRVADFY